MSWFVVRTKPSQEFRAEEHLLNQSFKVYLPRFSYLGKREQPLFSGYLFLANQSESPMEKVRSTRGVLNLVRFGDKLAEASNELIMALREKETLYQSVRRFNPNDVVRVKAGPFAHLEAIYMCKTGEERAIILLTLLNRQNKIEIDEMLLDKVV